MPVIGSGDVTSSPGTGDSTRMRGVTPSKSPRSTPSAGTPSPPRASTGVPSMLMSTASTVSNWVSVNTTCAALSCMDRLPPPDSNSPLRSTAAVPSATAMSSSSVPSGISLTCPISVSMPCGPSSSDSIAPRATAGLATMRPAVAIVSLAAK